MQVVVTLNWHLGNKWQGPTYKTKVPDLDGSSQENFLHANIQNAILTVQLWNYIFFQQSVRKWRNIKRKYKLIAVQWALLFYCLISNLGPVSNVVLCKMTRLKHDLDFGFYPGLSLSHRIKRSGDNVFKIERSMGHFKSEQRKSYHNSCALLVLEKKRRDHMALKHA